MNFDRNGVLVTTSRPKPIMKKSYRIVTVDSRDRDPNKFVRVNGGSTSSDPGDFVVYLPRPFQKVTRIRLMNAVLLGMQPIDMYTLMGIEGLNRCDECAPGGDRSGFVDSYFAKIINDRPAVSTGAAYTFSTIVAVGNRTFFQSNPAINSAVLSVTSGNATGTTVTYDLTFAPSINSVNVAVPVGSFVTISGFTGSTTVYNGTFQVIASSATNSTTSSFTVFNAASVGASSGSGAYVYSTSNRNPLITGTGTSVSGTTVTIGFTGAHTLSIGESITVNGFGTTPSTFKGTITSVPTANSLIMTSLTPFTGSTPTITVATNIFVNNLSYAYQTPVATSFVTGQYLVISGLSATSGANASAQIVQASPGAPLTSTSPITVGTFETTNVNNGPVSIQNGSGTSLISQILSYNDMSYAPNITYYNPPIGTLDRFHITFRRHLATSAITTTNPVTAPITFGPAENTLTFEIEYLDNAFEDVSTFETRLDNSDYTPKLYV
jgi:hypothetical protein